MTRSKTAGKTEKQRLQKVLAQAGVASRRASELLIEAGRVSVNGEVVTTLGTKVDPDQDTIVVDGQPLSGQAQKLTYIILNKPRHILSAVKDDRGRQTVVDLVDIPERVHPVGRLDLLSEGLILLTNDGELTKQITHPSHHIEKEYQVLVEGQPSTDTLWQWRRGGIEVDGRPTDRAVVERMKYESGSTWLKIVLTEGRKRQIREVAKILGHRVKKLVRVRIGPIRLGALKVGNWRYLTPTEVQLLKQEIKRMR